jgi:hypothetical protein
MEPETMTRKPGQPHKGWKDAARGRFRREALASTSFVCVEAGPGLCECEACGGSTATLIPDLPFGEGEAQSFLDTLPRSQWAYADTMLRLRSGWPKDRAVEFAKAWLRDRIIHPKGDGPRQGATGDHLPSEVGE